MCKGLYTVLVKKKNLQNLRWYMSSLFNRPRRCASPPMWSELCWCSFISQTLPLWRAAVLTDTRALRFLLATPRPKITPPSCQHREVRSPRCCFPSLVLRFAGFYFCGSACFALWSAVRCRFEFSGVKHPGFCSWIFPKLGFPLYLSVWLSHWTLGT